MTDPSGVTVPAGYCGSMRPVVAANNDDGTSTGGPNPRPGPPAELAVGGPDTFFEIFSPIEF